MTEQLADVSHEPSTDPATATWFRSGATLATDGGRRTAPHGEEQDEHPPERDATTERLAEVSHTHEDQPEYQGEMWKRGRDVPKDDE